MEYIMPFRDLRLSNKRIHYFTVRMFGYGDTPVDLFSFDFLKFTLSVCGKDIPCRKEAVTHDGTVMVVSYVPPVIGLFGSALFVTRYRNDQVSNVSVVNVGKLYNEKEPDVKCDYTPILIDIKDKRL